MYRLLKTNESKLFMPFSKIHIRHSSPVHYAQKAMYFQMKHKPKVTKCIASKLRISESWNCLTQSFTHRYRGRTLHCWIIVNLVIFGDTHLLVYHREVWISTFTLDHNRIYTIKIDIILYEQPSKYCRTIYLLFMLPSKLITVMFSMHYVLFLMFSCSKSFGAVHNSKSTTYIIHAYNVKERT